MKSQTLVITKIRQIMPKTLVTKTFICIAGTFFAGNIFLGYVRFFLFEFTGQPFYRTKSICFCDTFLFDHLFKILLYVMQFSWFIFELILSLYCRPTEDTSQVIQRMQLPTHSLLVFLPPTVLNYTPKSPLTEVYIVLLIYKNN